MGILHPINETYKLVRRSSRANKGQHSKFDSATARKKKKVDVVDDEEEGEIRCLCGDNEDDGGFMIQCEQCHKWQHGECMAYEDPDEVQDSYACELCRPDLYKDVVPKGEEIMEETTTTTTKKKDAKKEKSEPKVFHKSGKRLMKKSTKRKTPPPADDESDDDSEFSADDDEPLVPRKRSKTSASIQSPPPPPPKKSPSQESRKSKPPPIITARRPSHQSPQHPQRRSSQPATPSTPAPLTKTPLVTTFSELSDQKRAPAARIFAKIFEPMDPTRSESLGLAIEHALYSTYATSEPGYGSEYKNKFRSISFNLKDAKNTSLRERVLSGNLVPEELVKMSSEEMANQELREQAERIREEGVAQSVLKIQEGPRIRRTHKGEEIVGDEVSGITPTEDTASAPFARTEERSPSVKAAEDEVPASPRSIGSNGSGNFASPPPQLQKKMSIDTTPERKSSMSNFDMSNVWSHLQSPTSQVPSKERMDLDILPEEEISQNKIDDPDIDRMLNDNEPVDSPPYSPSAEAFELPNTSSQYPPIWNGTISMQHVTTFSAQARFVGGPHSITDLPWSTILPTDLVIDGRIAIDTTTKYLDAQRVSSTKDIIVLQFEAAEDSQKPMALKLYQYFHERQRYGVLQIHSQIVKDAYVIPLAPDQAIPTQIEVMDSHEIPRTRTEPYLLAILVIQKNLERSPLAQPPIAKPIAVSNSPPNPEITPQQTFSPATHQSTAFSPPMYIPPTAVTASPSAAGIEGLGLSAADLAALQSILIAHPEILSNPEILTNPTILQNLLQQHLGGGQNLQGW